MASLIEVAEARRLLLDAVASTPAADVPLDAALGRALAADVAADRDVPATDRSAMDGFAVRCADLLEAGRRLRVAGELRAGSSAAGVRVAPGEAWRIFTGGVVPEGADAVVMVELTEEDRGTGTLLVREAPSAGQNIRRRGEDVRAGERILRAGCVVGPAEVAALASVGAARVRVHRAPTVAILSTGDELVEAGETPEPHQIRNSNAPMLAARLRAMAIEPVPLGNAGDSPDALDAKLARGLDHDLLLVTGGVSVGDYDLVARRLEAAGATTLFHGVAMKPGKPILAARSSGGIVVGLPGNPLSAFTGFEVLVAPALRRMAGATATDGLEVRAILRERLRRRPGRLTYALARLVFEGGRAYADPVKSMSSGDVVSLSRANAFLIVPGAKDALEAGVEVDALLWGEFRR
ncbi:MAG TPA: gephyrin-like molybdotransferase Glp [Candidatus Polarisedimenticolaceae bacterium]